MLFEGCWYYEDKCWQGAGTWSEIIWAWWPSWRSAARCFTIWNAGRQAEEKILVEELQGKCYWLIDFLTRSHSDASESSIWMCFLLWFNYSKKQWICTTCDVKKVQCEVLVKPHSWVISEMNLGTVGCYDHNFSINFV